MSWSVCGSSVADDGFRLFVLLVVWVKCPALDALSSGCYQTLCTSVGFPERSQ